MNTVLRGWMALALALVVVGGLGLTAVQDLRAARLEAEAELVRVDSARASTQRRLAEMAAAETVEPSAGVPAIQAADAFEAEIVLQDRVLELADMQGIMPLNFGPTSVPVQTDHPALGFEFEAEAGHDAAVAFVEALEQSVPPIAIHNIWLRQMPVGTLGDVPTPVSLRLSLWSFWAPGPGN